jgi:hypothetical protein
MEVGHQEMFMEFLARHAELRKEGKQDSPEGRRLHIGMEISWNFMEPHQRAEIQEMMDEVERRLAVGEG